VSLEQRGTQGVVRSNIGNNQVKGPDSRGGRGKKTTEWGKRNCGKGEKRRRKGANSSSIGYKEGDGGTPALVSDVVVS